MPTPSFSRSRRVARRLLTAFTSLLVALTATVALSPVAQAVRAVDVTFTLERASVSAGDPLRGTVRGDDEYSREHLAASRLSLYSSDVHPQEFWDVAADGSFSIDTTRFTGDVTLELIDADTHQTYGTHDVVVDTTPWTPTLTVTAPDVAIGEESVVRVTVDDPLRRIDDVVHVGIHGEMRSARFVDGIAEVRFTKTPGHWLVNVELPSRGARQETTVQVQHLVQGHETNLEVTGPKYGAVGQTLTLTATHDTDLPVDETMSLDTDVCTVDGLRVNLVGVGDCVIRADIARDHPTWHHRISHARIRVGAVATTLEVTAPTTIAGDEARVTARVLVNGEPVPAVGNISLTAGDYSVTRVTRDGTTSFGLADLDLGTHDVEMEFSPHVDDWSGSFGSGTVDVIAAPTTVDVTTSRTVLIGNDADVRLRVLFRDTTAAVAGTFTITSGSHRAQQATTNGIATVRIPTDALGAQSVEVTFTPASNLFAAGTGTTTFTVLPHDTWVDVVTPAEAEVGDGKEIDVAVRTGSQRSLTGTVTLRVGRTTLTRTGVTSRATFSLADVPAGTHAVQATFTPDGDDFTSSTSSTTTLRLRPVPLPRITARVVSAHPVTASGWYRNAVTVVFTCDAPRAPLAHPCPAPVTLRHGRHAAIERVITTTTTGHRASVRVPAINVDLKAPHLKASLLAPLTKTAHLNAPSRPKCVAGDSTSGVATCTIKATVTGSKVTWTATATDRAGNVSTRVATTTLVKARIKGAKVVSGAAQAKAAKAHVLEVRSSSRPTLKGHTFTKLTTNTWRTSVKFTAAQIGTTVTLKPKAGRTTLAVKVKVSR